MTAYEYTMNLQGRRKSLKGVFFAKNDDAAQKYAVRNIQAYYTPQEIKSFALRQMTDVEFEAYKKGQ